MTTRLRLLHWLANHGPALQSDIAIGIGLSRSSTGKQLKALAEAGDIEPAGTVRRLNRLGHPGPGRVLWRVACRPVAAIERGREQYETLREDIRQVGLRDEIVLYEGAILDGKHRHRACLELGIEPRFRQYEGNDPAGFAYSGIAGRHLSKGQLAMAGARLKGYYAEKAKARMAAGGAIGGASKGVPNSAHPLPDQGKARDAAAAKVGVAGTSVDIAEKVIKQGVPALVKMVEKGEISLHKGEAIAALPKERQRTIVEMATPKERDAALSRSVNAAAKKKAPVRDDRVPGTPLVCAVLSRLELIANEIANSGLAPAAFAERFRDEFDWSEPILVGRLERAGAAIDAIAALSMLGQQAKRVA